MQTFIFDNCHVPVINDTDVLVCGGGPAGIGAALRAAREGVSVTLVESQGCLGGIATAGMMSNWGGRSSSKVLKEIYDLTYEKSKDIGWCKENECGLDAIYHDIQKIALEEMLLKEGVKLLYRRREILAVATHCVDLFDEVLPLLFSVGRHCFSP